MNPSSSKHRPHYGHYARKNRQADHDVQAEIAHERFYPRDQDADDDGARTVPWDRR